MTPSKGTGTRTTPQRAVVKPTTPTFVPPYPPSWFDRLTTAVDRLPGPYWMPYFIAFVVYLGLVSAVRGRDGQPVSLEVVYSHSLPFYGFWLIHYLNRRATASLRAFRPAFTGTEVELREVGWRLTALPAGPAAGISLVALLLAIASSLGWDRSSASQVLGILAYYATLIFAGLYVYHAIRQLRMVTSLYARWARVDIHNVAPLYSFSTLSAQTGIGMLLILSGAVLFTSKALTGGFLVGAVLLGALAVLTFLLPLTGLHRRLADEKDLALAENGRRWQACIAELYHLIDRGDLVAADHLNETLAALERGRTAIERIPTWPWRPETLHSLVAALVLPVAIWLVQYGLERVLG